MYHTIRIKIALYLLNKPNNIKMNLELPAINSVEDRNYQSMIVQSMILFNSELIMKS